MVMTVMIMARVVVAGCLLCGELLGSIGLGGGVEVLDLSLAEDAVRVLTIQLRKYLDTNLHVSVAGRRLIDIGLVDDEEDLGTVVRLISYCGSGVAEGAVCGQL